MGVKRNFADDESGAPPKSVMQAEDGAFPRGGGSVLSSLEIKQVSNEAAKDVLFGGADEQPKKKKQRKRKPESKPKEEDVKKGVKLETLSFAKLSVGTVLLGQISKVNQMDLAVSLPNNLTGFVPITNMSRQMTQMIETEIDDEAEENEIPDVSMFKAGQWLRCVVASNTAGESGQKKRIELSIEPEKVNAGLLEETDDLTKAGIAVQGSVKSVEDHGCVIDLGSDKIVGFISKKELSHASLDSVSPGMVLLLSVLNKAANGRTLTLTASALNKKLPIVDKLSSSESLTAGMLVECPITSVRSNGLVTKVLEFADGVVDQVHANQLSSLEGKFKVDQKIKARVICVFTDTDPVKVALSLKPNIVGLKNHQAAAYHALDVHPFGQIVKNVEVQLVNSMGLYVKFDGDKLGYVHISGVSDTRINDLPSEAQYAAGTKHTARVVGYCDVDDMYMLSMTKSTLEQKFLRSSDIPVGEVVEGKIEKIIPAKGVVVKLADSIDGFVDELHLSDIKLAHPEKKFKQGMKVKARVLSNNNDKNKLKLTLKKSLINSEDAIIKSHSEVEPDMKSPGVVVQLKDKGAIVEFFQGVKAFLPVAEMSEAFIKDPSEHFNLGQSIALRVLDVDAENNKMTVTCRSGPDNSKSMAELKPGQVVSAEVIEKPKDSTAVVVRLESGLQGVVPAGHLSNDAHAKHKVGMKNVKVGEPMELVVLEKDPVKRIVTLSAKKTLISDAKKNKLPADWSDIAEGKTVHGYIKNITSTGLFVAFVNRLTGLVFKGDASDEFVEDLNQKFAIDQLVKCRITSIDDAAQRFNLSLKSATKSSSSKTKTEAAVNPVDSKIQDLSEYVPGCVTKAKVISIKETQVNVQLADNRQGRIDASMAFNDVGEIKDASKPLKSSFHKGDIVNVKVIGYHDAKNHKFLPFSHRHSTHVMVECSCRQEDLDSADEYTTIQLENIKVGSDWNCVVNNLTNDFVYVNVTPTIRGRISVLDLCNVDQVSNDLADFFPIGSIVKCRAVEIGDTLKLSAREVAGTAVSSVTDVAVGDKLPGIIVKITAHGITVRLGTRVYANAALTDVNDTFGEDGATTTSIFSPSELVKCQVVAKDGEKVHVALRQSLFDQNVEPQDKLVQSPDDVGNGEVVRGFVKNVAKAGLFVSLGRDVVARVKIQNLSDAFLSDWQSYFSVNQRVTGRVLSKDDQGRIELTLKDSAVTGEKKVVGLADLQEGQLMDGTIKRIEDYGVFVRLEGGASGLCHKSQVADIPVSDLTKVFGVGDKVRVKVLKVDTENNRLGLGMKASYFGDDESDEDMGMDQHDEEEDDDDDDDDSDVAMAMDSADSEEEEEEEEEDDDDDDDSEDEKPNKRPGLSAGFDWTASVLDQAQPAAEDSEDSDQEDDGGRRKKRRRTKTITQDKTGALSTKTPQSVQDFERVLVGTPSSSIMWMQYMAFQIQLSEIDKAREIGERALKTISYREEQEKMNVWIAMLNLEHSFGTDETLDQVFKRSLQYNDPLTMHKKLINMYAAAGKKTEADKLYQVACKKFGAADMSIYVAYMQFLLADGKQDHAKRMLDRSLQALPRHEHRQILTKYAQLQFEAGFSEQARTFFEQLVSTYPKRVDLWNVYIDYECKYTKDAPYIRDLFERVFNKLNLNVKKARFFFKKWFAFEEKNGDKKQGEYVKAKAQQFVQQKAAKNEADDQSGDEDDDE